MLPEFLTEESFLQKIPEVEADLDAKKASGTLSTFDGKELYYEFFKAENARATVAVVHGLSEFTRKFYEFTSYLLSLGYNVFLYDQRCHGNSQRLTDDLRLIHVDRFHDYVCDLKAVTDKIKELDNAPIYLYAHSMGGAVAAFFLAEHTDTVKKAILTAPMFRPCVGNVPVFAARLLLVANKLTKGGSSRFAYSKDFNPEHKFRHTSDASYNRFRHNLDTRINNERYQSTPMSVSWVAESLSIKNKILKNASKIKTPILLLSPALDTVVKRPPQFSFAKKCKSCVIETVDGAKHSMLTGNDETIKEHITRIARFYSDN